LRILEKSLEVLKKKSDINLSINLALEDILDGEIKSFIFENFCDSLARRVGFEILESEIGNYDEVDEFIKRLKTKGVSFAIDDFGSGYSSFVRIVKLKVDYIKIDGSIIKNIDKDPTSLSILKTIVNFAKENNLKTVAEFIHNKEVFEIAKSVGVDYFQGFYLHEPSPFEKIIKV
ncbi:MAG: EAL domain-containing protein, partial [Nautiliaceae bacterium]